MKVAVPAVLLLLFSPKSFGQYLPPDGYFSGGGPGYNPLPQADNVQSPTPTGLTTAGYQWWANNLVGSGGPRNAPVVRTALGDLPAVNFEMADLRLPWAWEMSGPSGARISGAGVKVAVIDDGIDWNHADFAADAANDPAVDTDDAHHWNFFNLTHSPMPLNTATDKHGTALAGIIAGHHGAGTGNLGLAGVAPRSTLQGLVALKEFLNDDLKWVEGFAYGSVLEDTDHDGSLLDEARTGMPYFDICVNAAASSATGAARDLFPESRLWHRAVRNGATRGRDRKGTVYITSAGDGADGHMNTNYSEQKNTIYQIPVTGVSDLGRRLGYANAGANIVCAAPAGGGELPPVLAWTSRPNNFPTNRAFARGAPIEPDDVPAAWRRRTQGTPAHSTPAAAGNNFNLTGTAAPAAQVAGIVALMLEKRPDLQARDVKEILLRSGRVVSDVRYNFNNQPLGYEPNGPDSSPQQTYPWDATGAHPPPTLAQGPTQWRMTPLGRPLHHALGAGLIDAARALKIAERWTLLPVNPLPPIQRSEFDSGDFIGSRKSETGGLYFPSAASQLIPTDGRAVEVLVPPPPLGMRVEHVEVRVRLYHGRRGDLEIKLVAPGEVAWDGTGRKLVSDLFVPHREDSHTDLWHPTDVTQRRPLDWTLSTVRHWGTRLRESGSGPWKVVVRDAINKGTTTSITANDPVLCDKADPLDTQSQRLEGVAITYHGAYPNVPLGLPTPWDPPAITTSGRLWITKGTGMENVPLSVAPMTQWTDGQPAFPVTSWDFFHLPDIVPVHAAAPAKSPFVYFPPGFSSAGEAPASALYPTLNHWPATPAWVPLTTPPAAPVTSSSGAMVSRPRWAELSVDGRFLVLRDSSNPSALNNFIHVRLNRAQGVLEVIPWNAGTFQIRVIAENLLGISQPQLLDLRVIPDPASYIYWVDGYFPAADRGNPMAAGPNADPDNDGYNNRLEHALAGDPLAASPELSPKAGFVDVAGEGRFATLTFTRRAQITGVTFSVQFSGVLMAWYEGAVLVSSVSSAAGPHATVTETWRSSTAVVGAGARVFGRVVVTANP